MTGPAPTPALVRIRDAYGAPVEVRVLRHRGSCSTAADVAFGLNIPVFEAACDGACWAAPAATVLRAGHRHRFAHLDATATAELAACARGECDEPQAGSGAGGLTARLGRTDGTLGDVLAQGGYAAYALATTLSSSRMIEVIALADLIRRFDARALMAPVLRIDVTSSTIDTHLLEGDPHRVIEGVLLACIAGGSRDVRLGIAPDASGAASLIRALEDAHAAGILDGSALGGDPIDIEIVEALDGPSAASVETLCALTTVFDEPLPPTRLVALAGALPRPGVYEVPVGGAMTWAGVLAMAGVMPAHVQALRVHPRTGAPRLIWSRHLDDPLDPAALGGRVAVLDWDADINPVRDSAGAH